jgi:hypothetical protein
LDSMNLDRSFPLFPLAVAAVSELVAVWCLFRLWRRRSPIRVKLFWSLVLIVPVFGPLLFGALGRPLPPNPDHAQAPFDLTRHDPSDLPTHAPEPPPL